MKSKIFHTSNNKPIEIDHKEAATFETAISETGFGKYNIILLLIVIPSSWAAHFSSSSIMYVIPAAECDLNLSLNQKGLLNAANYSGMVCSAIVWGFLADIFGRKKLLVLGYLVDGILAIICSMSQNFLMLLLTKLMMGFVITAPLATLVTMLSEFHCAKYRARLIMLVGIFFNTASVALPLLAWVLVPSQISIYFNDHFVLHSWNLYLLICALPSVINTFAHMTLPESPKFLMTAGKNEEALQVFRTIYASNTRKSADTFPIHKLVNETENIKDKSIIEMFEQGRQQMISLFHPPNVSNLFLIACIQFGNMMGCNTLKLWLPQIFTSINDYKTFNENETSADLCQMLETLNVNKTVTTTCVMNTANAPVYINTIIVALVSIIGYTLAGAFINKLGKKTLLFTLGMLSASCILGLYATGNLIIIIMLTSLSICLSSICTDVMISVVVDLFPTTLRAQSFTFMMTFGRIGIVSGNILFPLLLTEGCLYPFLTISLITTGCTLLTLMLPPTDLVPLK